VCMTQIQEIKAVVELDINKEIIRVAHQMDKHMGQLRNSITKGKGNIYGFLGEILFNSLIKGRQANTYDYDLITKKGYTVDVKTKKCTTPPKTHYDCSVASLNTKQRCDVYGFVRVLDDMSKGWVLGYLPKEVYYQKARLLRRGQVDPSNNFKVHTDCYNVSISELKEVVYYG